MPRWSYRACQEEQARTATSPGSSAQSPALIRTAVAAVCSACQLQNLLRTRHTSTDPSFLYLQKSRQFTILLAVLLVQCSSLQERRYGSSCSKSSFVYIQFSNMLVRRCYQDSQISQYVRCAVSDVPLQSTLIHHT